VGPGRPLRREAAVLDEAGRQPASLSIHGALAPVECQFYQSLSTKREEESTLGVMSSATW
jgi:hypothetical protein